MPIGLAALMVLHPGVFTHYLWLLAENLGMPGILGPVIGWGIVILPLSFLLTWMLLSARLLRLAGDERVPLTPPPGVAMIERVIYAVEPIPLPSDLADLLRAPCAVALHSAAAARHFAAECDRLRIARGSLTLVAIGSRIAEAAGRGWEGIATAATPAYLREEIGGGRATVRTAARHSVLVQLFLATMALAVLAANLGVVWVAVEATTIVTAFLVGQRRTRASVEAAWKYVVICSAGIALALLGTIVLNFAAAHAPGTAGLDLAALATHAPGLDPGVTRIAIVLLVLGFGTKAGLAPLHAWLPDAQAPPIV